MKNMQWFEIKISTRNTKKIDVQVLFQNLEIKRTEFEIFLKILRIDHWPPENALTNMKQENINIYSKYYPTTARTYNDENEATEHQ